MAAAPADRLFGCNAVSRKASKPRFARVQLADISFGVGRTCTLVGTPGCRGSCSGSLLPTTLLIFLASGCATAQEVDFIGRVIDENSTAIESVRITLRSGRSSGLTVHATAISDHAGDFRLRLQPGEHLLSAERDGFFAIHEKTISLTDPADELVIVLPRLRQTSEAINVSAIVPGVDVQGTTSERRITGRQIIDVPYPATRDFRNALPIMPGVLRQPNGRLSFDGGAEEQVYFSLNGFNVADPVTGRFTTRLPVESVRSVEYASGRYSPEFGKGSAGALTIQTTNGDDRFRYSATNFVPGIETQKGLHIGTWSPRFNISGPILRGRAWFSESVDGEYSVAVIPDLPRGQDRTSRLRGASLLHGQLNLTPSQILSLDLLGGFENLPGNGLSALDPVSTTTDRGTTQRFVSVKDQMYFARGLVVDAGYAHSSINTFERPQGTGYYRIRPEGRDGYYFVNADQRSRRDQIRANVFAPAFLAWGNHQIKVGVDIDVVRHHQNAYRTGYENYSREGLLISRTTFGGPGSLSIRNTQASSYVVDVWQLRSDTTIEYGIREDWDELVGRIAVSPRASVAHSLFDSQSTRVAAGYAVVHDASTIAMFSRALDQYSMTTHFDSAGDPVDVPLITAFRANRRYQLPRSRILTAGFERSWGPRIRMTASVLRRRGDRGFMYDAASVQQESTPSQVTFDLSNDRRDVYDAVSITLHQTFGADYVWMANYTRSRALSNSVIDLSIDQRLRVQDNLGRLPWDAPHRFLSWGYLPAWNRNWAFAYMLDLRSGYPFSVVNDAGAVVGAANSWRFPMNLELNVHLERKFRLGKYRVAVRGGVNNVMNSANATGVDNVVDSPTFLRYYGRQGRHAVFRLRFLKQADGG